MNLFTISPETQQAFDLLMHITHQLIIRFVETINWFYHDNQVMIENLCGIVLFAYIAVVIYLIVEKLLVIAANNICWWFQDNKPFHKICAKHQQMVNQIYIMIDDYITKQVTKVNNLHNKYKTFAYKRVK